MASSNSAYPALSNIREVSAHIAQAVAVTARRQQLARPDLPGDAELLEAIQTTMYQPVYPHYA